MAALILKLGPGDEVIMPSYTFVSTANAIALRGATPVFVDIRPDTLNLNEQLLEEATNKKTKAIIPVHYAGVGCEMDAIIDHAEARDLAVIEDNAQGMCSSYKGRPLGSIGALGAISFHETKNVSCGEGGALLLNDVDAIDSAEVIREKGTDRSKFIRGVVDKYSWMSLGSSFLLGELSAAFLLAQLRSATKITAIRRASWAHYFNVLQDLASADYISLPRVPQHCDHNAHMFYVLLNERFSRAAVLTKLNSAGIGAVSHYEPLHLSLAGQQYGRCSGSLPTTEALSQRIIRLPLWTGISNKEIESVGSHLTSIISAFDRIR